MPLCFGKKQVDIKRHRDRHKASEAHRERERGGGGGWRGEEKQGGAEPRRQTDGQAGGQTDSSLDSRQDDSVFCNLFPGLRPWEVGEKHARPSLGPR